jgi:hypothetical protein
MDKQERLILDCHFVITQYVKIDKEYNKIKTENTDGYSNLQLKIHNLNKLEMEYVLSKNKKLFDLACKVVNNSVTLHST